MFWVSQCQMAMGVDFIEMVISGAPDAAEDHVGGLPDRLRLGFADIFGCPFERRVVFSRLAEDPPPDYILRGRR